MMAFFATPVGTLVAQLQAEHLVALKWHDDEQDNRNTTPRPTEAPPCYDALHNWLDAYFAASHRMFDKKWLCLDGLSPSMLALYDVLETIPYGHVTTYGMVAEKIMSSPRAVGQLLRHNRFALIIPCHRVIGSDGLKGYAGKDGIGRKQSLLQREGVSLPRRFISSGSS